MGSSRVPRNDAEIDGNGAASDARGLDRSKYMASIKRGYSKEEFARRGDALYDTEVRSHLKVEDEGKFVAIDIETGLFAVGDDELEASDRLRARARDAQIWLAQAGSDY